MDDNRKKAIRILERLSVYLDDLSIFDCKDGDCKWYIFEDLIVSILSDEQDKKDTRGRSWWDKKKEIKELNEEFGNCFRYELALKLHLEDIEELEKILLNRNTWSKEFRDSAYRERREKCNITSALYSLIEEGKENKQ